MIVMSGNDAEEFNLAAHFDEPTNSFKVVHLHNKSSKYHLTRQVLLDSAITQDTYCFFCHILTKSVDEFNQMYGSFACLIEKPLTDFAIESVITFGKLSRSNNSVDRNQSAADNKSIQADLYLNVESDALDHIIRYIQTTKIDGQKIYANDWRRVDEIIDLATMFGMPALVSMLRNLHPTDQTIQEAFESIKSCASMTVLLYKKYLDCNCDTDKCTDLINEYMDTNKQLVIDTYVKTNIYKNKFDVAKIVLCFLANKLD